jgi:hypothetical protein
VTFGAVNHGFDILIENRYIAEGDYAEASTLYTCKEIRFRVQIIVPIEFFIRKPKTAPSDSLVIAAHRHMRDTHIVRGS